MRNFGFTISQTRTIDLDQIDSELYEELEKKVPSFKVCMNCGACTATCSAQQFTEYDIRKIKCEFSRGQYDTLSESLRKCMLCGKCTLVCPRGINIRNSIIEMRKILMKNNK